MTNSDISVLFDKWNAALLTGDPESVVARYAEDSILLPTISDKPRFTQDEKLDYFENFLALKPKGKVEVSHIVIDDDMAVDSGIYEFHLQESDEKVRARYSFTYRKIDDEWLIVSHHSSKMPEQ